MGLMNPVNWDNSPTAWGLGKGEGCSVEVMRAAIERAITNRGAWAQFVDIE